MNDFIVLGGIAVNTFGVNSDVRKCPKKYDTYI